MKKSMEEMKNAMTIMEISIKNIGEMMKNDNKNNTVKTQYVGEETDTDGSCVDKDVGWMMVIDSGAPMSLVSSTWLEDYWRDMDVDEKEVERSRDDQRFELG